jgi:AcrR family transcriptional regulator
VTLQMSDEIELPAGIARAWGVHEHPGKGPKPGLSVPQIVRAAIATARDEGLAAVSMNRVAARLGTAAMSLYRYVASKDELIARMVDEAMGTPPDLPGPGEDWRAALAHWAHANLDVYRAQPWLVDLPIRGAPILPNGVAWFEQGLRCLAGTKLAEDEKVGVILLVSGLVRNQATLEVQLDEAMRASATEAVGEAYGPLLTRLTSPEQFPALHAAIAARAFDDDESAEDNLAFGFGLDRVLDGIAAYLRDRGEHV